MKEKGTAYQRRETYQPIHMPKNTASGIAMAACITAMGFAAIWHIWWLAIVGFAGTFVLFLLRAYDNDVDYYVQPDEVARIENAHLDNVARGR
jgi:cytochrome o ubiquinol oxidase subunit 1